MNQATGIHAPLSAHITFDLTVFIQAIGQQLHELYQGLLPWQVSQHLHVNSINGHEGDYIIIRYIIWENKHKHLLTQMSRSIT